MCLPWHARAKVTESDEGFGELVTFQALPRLNRRAFFVEWNNFSSNKVWTMHSSHLPNTRDSLKSKTRAERYHGATPRCGAVPNPIRCKASLALSEPCKPRTVQRKIGDWILRHRRPSCLLDTLAYGDIGRGRRQETTANEAGEAVLCCLRLVTY